MRFNVYVLETAARYFTPSHKAGFAEYGDAVRYASSLGADLTTTQISIVVEGEIKEAKRGQKEEEVSL